jgi:hypothetical protein
VICANGYGGHAKTNCCSQGTIWSRPDVSSSVPSRNDRDRD